MDWEEYDYELADKLLEQEEPCDMECVVRDGYFYCISSNERCRFGIFDKPWSRSK